MHRVVDAARHLALRLPIVARLQPAQGSLHQADDHHRDGPAGHRAHQAVRHPPGGRHGGPRAGRFSARSRSGRLRRAVARRLPRRRRCVGGDAHRERRGLLGRRQPGAAQHDDARRAGPRPRALLPPGPVRHRRPPRQGVTGGSRTVAVRRVGRPVEGRPGPQAALRRRRRGDAARPHEPAVRRPGRARSSAPTVGRCSSASSAWARPTRSSACSSSGRWSSTPRRGSNELQARQPALGPTVQDRRRSSGHPDRPLPAPHEPRRAAPADQRAEG